MLASIDPSNTPDEIASLVTDGWSTMYFGRTDEQYASYSDAMDELELKPFKCPKTYGRKRTGADKKDWNTAPCNNCDRGCFRASANGQAKYHGTRNAKPVHVVLKGH